ncbi:hypothetical protein [Anaeromassilibacillus senegalensis]|uniref:hypothetical protein n=1 Tax=Anaeromassilibacillus senegalensis TaxID=1673717 RepID=UPI0006807815|nr:hypothetical protein [Anaeromassilibacillus senegalensis]
MRYTYRIWDKESTVNGFPADKVLQSFGIDKDDQVYILVDSDGVDRVVQSMRSAPYPGTTIEESAQNHIDAILAEDERQQRQELTMAQTIAAQEEALKIITGGTNNG